jgi:hypothetical protein
LVVPKHSWLHLQGLPKPVCPVAPLPTFFVATNPSKDAKRKIFLSRPPDIMGATIKAPTMPGKNYFHYKKGHTEIDSDANNKAAIRLAYLNTILYWLVRLLPIIVALLRILSG